MNDTTQQWAAVFDELMQLLKTRRSADPAVSYSAALLQGDANQLLKKLVEEAGEAALAAKDGEPDKLCAELADLWFHCFIAMTRYNIELEDVAAVLAQRRGSGGLVEKASRS